jgi:hypothetical protein
MAIVVKSDFWGNNYSFINANSPIRRQIARLFNQYQTRSDRALLRALNGAAAGGAASATQKRVEHDRDELGGLRVIETQTFVNRVTTSADETAFDDDILSYTSRPTSYPVDKATNP